MDRFQSETYTAATPAHFRSEEAYLDWLANQEPEPEEIEIEEVEPVEAAWLSDCCAAPCRIEQTDYTVCPDTGYREGGDAVVCAACGKETEESLQPVFTARVAVAKKPVKMQGELFEREVA